MTWADQPQLAPVLSLPRGPGTLLQQILARGFLTTKLVPLFETLFAKVRLLHQIFTILEHLTET